MHWPSRLVALTALVLALSGVLISGLTTHAGAGGDEPAIAAAQDRMTMVGNMEPYPDLERAGERNVRRARRLQRASRRSAHRFDTLARANRLGYETGHMAHPGFVHARKDVWRLRGRVLDPTAPQALVFWCPRHGRCRLTTYMYRAPAGAPPSTWGRLLQWHRHSDRSTWLTHVWLLPDTRTAFATCAPWRELERIYGLRKEPYHTHVNDEPCPGATGRVRQHPRGHV